MISMDLANKVAVITGSSGALGRVMVRTLAQAGADIAICYYRDEEMARRLQAEITEIGVRGMVVQADVTDPDSINAMRDAVLETLGPADIIVNNARCSVSLDIRSGAIARRLRKPVSVVCFAQRLYGTSVCPRDDRSWVGARHRHQHRMFDAELCWPKCVYIG